MSDMSPEEFIEARETMGWTGPTLARFLECDEKTIRQMQTKERHIPPTVASWLRKAVRWLAANPPPDDWRVR
jgi:hypothetical protein